MKHLETTFAKSLKVPDTLSYCTMCHLFGATHTAATAPPSTTPPPRHTTRLLSPRVAPLPAVPSSPDSAPRASFSSPSPPQRHRRFLSTSTREDLATVPTSSASPSSSMPLVLPLPLAVQVSAPGALFFPTPFLPPASVLRDAGPVARPRKALEWTMVL